jgi:hypothetical protein
MMGPSHPWTIGQHGPGANDKGRGKLRQGISGSEKWFIYVKIFSLMAPPLQKFN